VSGNGSHKENGALQGDTAHFAIMGFYCRIAHCAKWEVSPIFRFPRRIHPVAIQTRLA
jgi:hypothetical protein